MKKEQAMLPTNDYVFKRIFGHRGNEEITKGLIREILKVDIQKVELNENTILEKDLEDDKVGILDIRARLDGDKVCNIEMQIVQNKDIEKRIMFYWSKLYASGIHEGEEYQKLNKTIVILIANFELENIKEIPKYHTKWEVREEEYRKVILTNVFELHIIELTKLIKQLKEDKVGKEDKLSVWARFIINPEEIGEQEMRDNKEVKQAKEEYDKIMSDSREQYLAYLRDKHIRDTKSIRIDGYSEGKAEGIREGIEEGRMQEKKKRIKEKQEIILNLYNMKMGIKDICKAVNLKKEEVEKIIVDSENKKV